MRAILLAGGPVHHRPGGALGLPRPLWPLAMRPLMLRLVHRLVEGGTQALSVCANGQISLYAGLLGCQHLGLDELCFVQDAMPRGPAGCLKDNETFVRGETFLAVNAACWLDDPVETLVERHHRQRNHLTVFCNARMRAPGGLYVVEPEVLDHIPAAGYCDIKEQLIPRLLDRGLRVGALSLHGATEEVIHVQSYLHVHAQWLNRRLPDELASCPGQYRSLGSDVWVSTDTSIGRNVRLFGPVIVGPRAKILDGAVVIGPACIGPETWIGENAIITEGVIWAKAYVPATACVNRALVVPADESAAGHRLAFASRFRRRVLSQLGSSSHVRYHQ